MTCQDILQKIEEFKAKFAICYKLKASDMDELMDLIIAVKNCSNNVYSTSETEVGLFNNEKLYRIMIPHSFDGNESYTYTHNLDIKEYTKFDFYAKSSTNSVHGYSIPVIQFMINAGIDNGYIYSLQSNSIEFGCDHLASKDESGYIIIEYTKN